MPDPQKWVSEVQFSSIAREDEGSLWSRWQLTETRAAEIIYCNDHRSPGYRQWQPNTWHISIIVTLLGSLCHLI
jgi:hypothetical protein